MQATADRKYAEALANDIADTLRNAPGASKHIRVRFDKAADTWVVRITINQRNRYELLMPAVGALYGLFRNGTWCGGLNQRSDAAPIDVAISLLDRISQTIR